MEIWDKTRSIFGNKQILIVGYFVIFFLVFNFLVFEFSPVRLDIIVESAISTIISALLAYIIGVRL